MILIHTVCMQVKLHLLLKQKIATDNIYSLQYLGRIKNKCVMGNGSEKYRLGRHTYFYLIFFS